MELIFWYIEFVNARVYFFGIPVNYILAGISSIPGGLYLGELTSKKLL